MYKKITGTEIFLVEDCSGSLIYAPLKDEIFRIDEESARQIRYASCIEAINDIEIQQFLTQLDSTSHIPVNSRAEPIEKTTKLSLIPNNICNLKCNYCYSAYGRNNTVIKVETLKRALNWYIDRNRIANSTLSIFITGGGEPLATWDITSTALEYSYHRAEKQGISLYTSIITNGTLLTKEKVDFLKKFNCKIGVSFDVLEDIQNLNRGEYNKVRQAMELLRDSGLRVMINTTITPSSVNRMTEIVEEVISNYPFVQQFTMEPVTSAELFPSARKLREFYDRFFASYIFSRKIATDAGLNLRFTFDDALRGITTRHCPGKFTLTPSGQISVCHLVSSPAEVRFKECTYGMVDEMGVNIDHIKFNELYQHNVFSYPKCEDCIAKWCCGGECMTRRATYPEVYFQEVCRFNIRFVEYLILNNLQ